MNNSNTIFFTSCNNAYIPYAIISLLKVRDFDRDAKLAIITRDITIANKKKLKKHNIVYYDLDLSDKIRCHWEYPEECYYYFAGPEIFLKEGIKYSIYFDSDVLCCGNPYLRGGIEGLAGVPIDSIENIFGDDITTIKNIFKIKKSTKDRKRINAGVIYFNNEFCRKKKMLARILELFEKCLDNNIPRKGDDSLFALFQLIYCSSKEVIYLNKNRNFIPSVHGKRVSNNVIFFHFSPIPKPWNTTRKGYGYEDMYKVWRGKYLSILPLGYVQGLYLPKKIKRASSIVWKHIVSFSDTILWGRYSVFRRIKNIKKTPIKTYWFRSADFQNFGDEFSRYIINYAFGYSVSLANINDCELVATGSNMEVVENNRNDKRIKIWGSGFIEEGESARLQGCDIYAVRGKETARRIGREELPMGDPGVLASRCFRKKRNLRTGKIGFVAHYVDLDSDIAQKIRSDERYMLISPLEKNEIVATKIASCKAILSSSLHGLIFADSYKVPNAHVQLSDKVLGGEYKFRDYCSGVGKKYIKVAKEDIFNEDIIENIIREYKPIKGLRKIWKRLTKSFPYK